MPSKQKDSIYLVEKVKSKFIYHSLAIGRCCLSFFLLLELNAMFIGVYWTVLTRSWFYNSLFNLRQAMTMQILFILWVSLQSEASNDHADTVDIVGVSSI